MFNKILYTIAIRLGNELDVGLIEREHEPVVDAEVGAVEAGEYEVVAFEQQEAAEYYGHGAHRERRAWTLQAPLHKQEARHRERVQHRRPVALVTPELHRCATSRALLFI